MKTHQAFLSAFVLFAGMLITGCQSTPSSSIVRVATLSKPLSTTCVTNAILAVPGITQVIPIAVTPAPVYSVYRLYEHKVPYVNFLYLGANGTRGIVTVKPQSRVPMVEDDIPALQLSRTWTDHKPSPAEIDFARKTMDDIYSSIRSQCGNLPPPESVQENFVNLKDYEQNLNTNTSSMKRGR